MKLVSGQRLCRIMSHALKPLPEPFSRENPPPHLEETWLEDPENPRRDEDSVSQCETVIGSLMRRACLWWDFSVLCLLFLRSLLGFFIGCVPPFTRSSDTIVSIYH